MSLDGAVPARKFVVCELEWKHCVRFVSIWYTTYCLKSSSIFIFIFFLVYRIVSLKVTKYLKRTLKLRYLIVRRRKDPDNTGISFLLSTSTISLFIPDTRDVTGKFASTFDNFFLSPRSAHIFYFSNDVPRAPRLIACNKKLKNISVTFLRTPLFCKLQNKCVIISWVLIF